MSKSRLSDSNVVSKARLRRPQVPAMFALTVSVRRPDPLLKSWVKLETLSTEGFSEVHASVVAWAGDVDGRSGPVGYSEVRIR